MAKRAATSDAGPSGEITPADRERASKIVDRARKVAETGQYDYAIELFLEGLGYDPDAGDTHRELRKISLTRKATGGKPLSGLKSMGLKRSSDAKQALLNAEKLLAYDPGNIQHMLAVAKAAQKGGYRQAALWIGPLVFRANLDGPKDTATFLLLKDMYKEFGEFGLAGDALGYAAASRPDDANLQHELRALAAQMTITQGRYGTGGDFRASVRDAERQRALMEEEMDIRDEEAMSGIIQRARRDYEEAPEDRTRLVRLVEVLTKTENAKYENEAMDLLDKTYKETQSYRFRYMSEEIKLKQMARMERTMREQLEGDPGNQGLRKTVEELAHDRLETELKHFRQAMQAYPTELRHRYEVGKRLFDLGRYTEAIPILQQAQSDPKYREEAGVLLGRAFLEADFVDEAVDTLRGRIDAYQIEGDTRAKEMYYWYGRALETKGDTEPALKAYSQIAQWDFGYRDVQNRIRELRGK
jgi:tetratricopeptide (TPR) repeat protein